MVLKTVICKVKSAFLFSTSSYFQPINPFIKETYHSEIISRIIPPTNYPTPIIGCLPIARIRVPGTMLWVGSVVVDTAGEIGSVATNIDVERVRAEGIIAVNIAICRMISVWGNAI
jgi:hypothetical protein